MCDLRAPALPFELCLFQVRLAYNSRESISPAGPPGKSRCVHRSLTRMTPLEQAHVSEGSTRDAWCGATGPAITLRENGNGNPRLKRRCGDRAVATSVVYSLAIRKHSFSSASLNQIPRLLLQRQGVMRGRGSGNTGGVRQWTSSLGGKPAYRRWGGPPALPSVWSRARGGISRSTENCSLVFYSGGPEAFDWQCYQ
jgi:hypothetical protein